MLLKDMNKFVFNTTPGIRFGAEILGSCTEEIISILGPRILFISDPELSNLGLYNSLLESLILEGAEIKLCTAINQDPTLENLQSALETGGGFLATGILGFGGGSPMDVAKLTALILGSGENLDDLWGVNKAKGPRLPLILVPTTSGTGSEVTPISIITINNLEKRGVSSHFLIPDRAILDPTLTYGLPSDITASTGIDAMVHAIEAYTSISKNKNHISCALAIDALGLLSGAIRNAVKNGSSDLLARNNMLLGSMLAGMSFANSPVAGIHALAYPLGGKFKISHGLSNSLMLPHVIRFNCVIEEVANAYSKIAPVIFPQLLDIENSFERSEALAQSFQELSQSLGLPVKLRSLKIPREACSEMAIEAMKQERLLVNNPRQILIEHATKLYFDAW